MTLGDFASIATLVLFALYFIGRLIALNMVKPLWNDKIVDIENATDIVEAFHYDDTGCGMAITATNLIRNLKIYEIDYDIVKGRYNYKKLKYKIDVLRANQSIAINAVLPDIMPKLLIEYETFEYMRVSFQWLDNLKNCVMSERPEVKHTFKSFIYFLCR